MGQDSSSMTWIPGTGSWSLLHVNASTYKIKSVWDFLAKIKYCGTRLPPVFTYLAPHDFCLFPKLKLAMKGKQFDTIADIQKTLTEILETIPKNEFEEVLQKNLQPLPVLYWLIRSLFWIKHNINISHPPHWTDCVYDNCVKCIVTLLASLCTYISVPEERSVF